MLRCDGDIFRSVFLIVATFQRLALWGTSFAGGHMVVAAAELGTKVKAVISQVPHMDGRGQPTVHDNDILKAFCHDMRLSAASDHCRIHSSFDTPYPIAWAHAPLQRLPRGALRCGELSERSKLPSSRWPTMPSRSSACRPCT